MSSDDSELISEQKVCPRIVLRLLREARILEGLADGSVTAAIKRTNLTSLEHHQERGTVTQIVRYFRDGVKVAVVRQFLRPDGTLGASGLPTPQYLLHEGVVYRPSHRHHEHCPECEH